LSDPSDFHAGIQHNASRGGIAVTFGQDVTEAFLKQNNLQFVIRSHLSCYQGWMMHHQNQCMTVFSAANYQNVCRNEGAIIKFPASREQELSCEDMMKYIITFQSKHYPME
jgi:serine/threonine-protein phosphatase 5